MAVLKAPPSKPKNETIQIRVPQDVKLRLARYAEFINASPSYVVIEMLERLFRKDCEFQEYLASYPNPQLIAEQHTATNEETQPTKLTFENSKKNS